MCVCVCVYAQLPGQAKCFFSTFVYERMGSCCSCKSLAAARRRKQSITLYLYIQFCSFSIISATELELSVMEAVFFARNYDWHVVR